MLAVDVFTRNILKAKSPVEVSRLHKFRISDFGSRIFQSAFHSPHSKFDFTVTRSCGILTRFPSSAGALTIKRASYGLLPFGGSKSIRFRLSHITYHFLLIPEYVLRASSRLNCTLMFNFPIHLTFLTFPYPFLRTFSRFMA